MPDIQLGCHTIQSHGTKVARLHMYDWIILLCLAVLDGLLNIIEPFHRFVGRDMMTDLSYPLKGNTIPFWAVPVCSCSGTSYFDFKYWFNCAMHNMSLGMLFFSWFQLIAIVLPWVIFGVIYFKKKNVYDLHHGILGTWHSKDVICQWTVLVYAELKKKLCRDLIFSAYNCCDHWCN